MPLRFFAAVLGVMLVVPAPTSASANPQGELEVEPGRFLVRRADFQTAAASEAVAPLGWAIVEGDPTADPIVEARRLEALLGSEVVPDAILEFAADPLFGDQWYLANTGQTGGTAGADVGALEAWQVGTGQGAVVAVIDSGADLTHPDLAENLWNNPVEIGGNGIDDDGNGLTDDDLGWDFVEGDAVPQDLVGHGTKVAGIVAAESSAAVGITGLAYEARIMVLRACSTTCSVSRVAAAVDYAVAAGADVINISLGGGAAGIDPLGDAIARAGAADVLVVAAAGNSGVDLAVTPFYPASFPEDHIISVAASDADDALAGFSNYGDPEVDLAAPGTDILSTDLSGTWVATSGTSFSSPLVAAAAAMVRGLRPELSAVGVKDFILNTVDHPPGLVGSSLTDGRLDAGEAMFEAAQVTVHAGVSPLVASIPVELNLDASDSTGPISSSIWTIDGVSYNGLIATHPVSTPRVVNATIEIIGITGSSDSASFTAYIGASFDDLDDSVFTADIAWFSANGFTHGCSISSFCPNDVVTRGEAAAMIRRVLRPNASAATDPFTDDDSSIFEHDLAALHSEGVMLGCNPPAYTLACPDDPMTRAQMAAMLTRALNLPSVVGDVFSDDNGSVFEDAIERLAAAGITKGCNPPANDRFCPERTVIRGEIAAMLRRAPNAADTFPDS